MPGATLDIPLVRHILASFETRGVPACFRLTGLEAGDCDAVLAEAGLAPFDPSLGMCAPLDGTLEIDPSVRIEAAPKPAWIAAAAAAQTSDKQDRDVLGRIVRRIRQPAGFATLDLDGQHAAWGFAVCERGHVGLYDIVVAPDLRGVGLGRRLVASLMAWGEARGATTAYLQMRETNLVAAALYASLGFTTAYRYTHRIVPAEPRRERGVEIPEE